MARDMKTFVALRVRADICRQLHQQATRLKEIDADLRPVPVDDIHMILQFLGATPDHDIHLVSRALERVAADHPPIDLDYVGLGAFPEPARARVVWAGVRQAKESEGDLQTLVREIGDALGELGFPPERRRFHPHVSIGRIRKPPSEAFVAALDAAHVPEEMPANASGEDLTARLTWGSEIVSEVKLIVSDPGQQPYHYTDLTTVDLDGDGDRS